jgi:DNA gyrase/topoisomerase IV subunit B
MSESKLSKKYKKLSPIEHVLLKPGMYVGDIDFRVDEQLILVVDYNQYLIHNKID